MIQILHRPFLYFIACIGGILLLHPIGSSAQAENGQHIHLRNITLTPQANTAAWLDSFSAIGQAQPTQVLLHFNRLPDEAERALLEQNGVRLLGYLPDNTFSAVISGSVDRTALLSTSIHSITSIQPEWKAGSYVWRKAARQKGSVEVLVSFSGVSDAEVRQFVASMGGTIDPAPMEKYASYKVVIASSSLRSLAQWYGVRCISPVSKIMPLDLESRPAVKGNLAAAPFVYGGYGLMGDSVTVGIGDESSGIYHIDLKDRIINFNPAANSHHGEHVNGIVGGAAIIDPLAISMAPHTTLIDYLFDLILPDEGVMYHDHNMTITNNSYEIIGGDCGYSGTYDGYSQLLDTLAIQYPFVQNVFASGNDGYLTCSPFPAGFATVGGGYQPAKNNIVVGSMTDFLVQASDESRGPVKDGRIKPDIVAVGLGAYSTIGVDQYEWAAGTSMASPQAAGGLALLTQRYKQLHSTQPRADLLKALLLNGAMDAGNPGPDFSYGFGIMDVYRSLSMIDSGHYFSGALSNGDSQSFTINVPPNTGVLKVMLCWNDVPASAYAAKELVNDLDLKLLDPSGAVHLPLVPDPTPANVNNIATEQADHTNNVEQVTINNPAPGTYTIKARGYNIPYGPQAFAIAYDTKPKSLKLTFPVGGEQLANSMDPYDSMRVFWDAVSDGNSFTVQLSQDNGVNWTTIDNNVPPDVRHSDFIVSGISSGRCLIRVRRNTTSEVVTSKPFVINTRPTAVLDTAQCPGYINIHWSPVLNASGYYLLKKVGNYLQVVDSTTDTAYSFANMPLTTTSYVTMQPKIDGLPGYRSLAVVATANSGNCTKSVSNGDLMVEKLVSPNAGRMFTSTDFATGAALKIRLRTLYDSSCSHYTLSYEVNGGAWQTLTNPGTIPANSTADITLPSFPVAPGSYNVTVVVHNLTLADPQPLNDTLSFVIRRLQNNALDLSTPFTEGFEGMSVFTVGVDSIGVSPDGRWDYRNAGGFGEMRSFVNDNITISGNRSISLDQSRNSAPADRNTFVGTFNLSSYDTTTAEIRMDFDYVLHGIPLTADGNSVTIRCTDTAAWNQLFAYDLSGYAGTLLHARSLSITDAHRSAHRNFSPSCQVSFGQSDTSLIAAFNYGNGMTMDNVRIYTVANDAALAGVISPLPSNCGLSSPQPLTVQVHNGVNYTLHNIHLSYTLDGGTVFTGTLDSITAKATVNYTFSQQVTMTEGITHSINVWLSEAGDTYTANDSILNYHFRNNRIINSYPYLENFESGDGGYYSDGFRNSWQYGTPASPKINKAASGIKAWKTNLTGNYNNLERSYLYSPCFDISGLANPMLSFSTAMDIENCGNSLCDAGFIEISFDGVTWVKLGSTGSGTNWYDPTFNVWNTEGFTRWHVASIPLPQPGPGQITHLRFVLNADPGATFEGMAIDDIHVFDLVNPIAPVQGVATAVQNVSGGQWNDYLLSNNLLASVEPYNQAISNLPVTLYGHDTLSNPGATQYTFSRNYTIKPTQVPADSVGIRLFLTDSEVVAAYSDTTCPSCNHFADAYSLGVTQYDNANNRAAENGKLADDTGGVFAYYPYRSVTWVPYDKGYFAELKVKPLSEFWFNDGGPTGNLPAATDPLNFIAYRNGAGVTVSWYSLIDTVVNVYTPQWSADGVNFADVLDTTARHLPVAIYSVFDPINFAHISTVYYRLKWTMTTDDAIHYSPIRKITASDTLQTLITFDAQMIDHRDVQLTWTSFIDGIVNTYNVERAINNGTFSQVGVVTALHRYGQQYSFIDQPGNNIATGQLIHYRLKAITEDAQTITTPEKTVEWVNVSQIVSVYPNPATNGLVNIVWHADPGTQMNIRITDVAGKEVYRTSVMSSQWTNTTTIQSPQHPSGLYFAVLEIDGRRYIEKIVFLD